MKKSLLFAAVLCAFSALSAGAQVHVGLGASIGTDGIGIDAGLTATRWIGVRAGVSFLPSISPKFNVKTYNWVSSSSAGDVKVKGNIKWSEFKLLLDFHPIFGSGFHITAGAFIGNDMPIKANNIDPIDAQEGLLINDYLVRADANGIARAAVQVKKFKPYLGIGFGKAVPSGRIGFTMDLGVKFWGSPKVMAFSPDDNQYVQALPTDFNESGGNIIKTISKIKVYPVLSFRLSGRSF